MQHFSTQTINSKVSDRSVFDMFGEINHKESSAVVCIRRRGEGYLLHKLPSNVHYIFNVFLFVDLWTSFVKRQKSHLRDIFMRNASGYKKYFVLKNEYIWLKLNKLWSLCKSWENVPEVPRTYARETLIMKYSYGFIIQLGNFMEVGKTFFL